MPIIKGANVCEVRSTDRCGCFSKRYPLGPGHDVSHAMVFKRTSEADEKWEMQLHSHPDFEEYWFCLEGKGEVTLGNETYEVETGDLVLTPRGVPHKAKGDVAFLCVMTTYNTDGKTIGHKMQYVANDMPYRDDPSDLTKVGEYKEFEAD